MPGDRDIIEKISLAIEHRGSDEVGFHRDDHVHLASRRLSIIDLSAGEQPIYNKDNSRCIVYNGEIYNYRDFRKELLSRRHVFKTKTDTEVVLLAYEEKGERPPDNPFFLILKDFHKDRFLIRPSTLKQKCAF